MFDRLIHKYFRLPYLLSVDVTKVKKSSGTVVFLHGIGSRKGVWKPVIDKLGDDFNIVTIDLLGFGASPKPKWNVYNVLYQSRSVMATYLKLGIRGKVVFVGHSLGSLVAIDIAKRYPAFVHSLILCSPPIFNNSTTNMATKTYQDRVLKNIYKIIKKRPTQFAKVIGPAVKLKLVNKVFDVNVKNIDVNFKTLETTIINQTSFEDASKLKVPMNIIHGAFDPLVVLGNLKDLKNKNSNIKLESVAAGHEVLGVMEKVLVSRIKSAVGSKKHGR